MSLNNKNFLSKSINSSSMIHSKIKDNNIVSIRISDCNKTIRLWNNLNNEGELNDMIDKIDNITSNLEKLKDVLLQMNHKPETII